MQIRVPSEKAENITKLAELLKSYLGGNCRIAIDYMRDDAMANLKLGDAWRVRPTDALLKMLREIFMEENVSVAY